VFVLPELLAERGGSRDADAGQYQALAEKLFGQAALASGAAQGDPVPRIAPPAI
jgi:hypothetical protein